MTTISHEPALDGRERSQWAEFLRIPEMWASLAISAMWLAVLFTAIFGASLVHTSVTGASTTIPSAIFVSFFAVLGSAAVAKRGFRRTDR